MLDGKTITASVYILFPSAVACDKPMNPDRMFGLK